MPSYSRYSHLERSLGPSLLTKVMNTEVTGWLVVTGSTVSGCMRCTRLKSACAVSNESRNLILNVID